MPASVSGHGAVAGGGNQSSTNVPLATHLTGDILIIIVTLNLTGGTINTPTGWTQIDSTSSTSNVTTAVFWARASSDNQYGTQVNVTHSTFRRTSAASSVVISGSTTVDPYGAKGPSTAQSTTAPDLTITGDNTLLVAMLGYRTTGITWSMVDADWVEDDGAEGTGTNTGSKCGHRTSLVNAGSYTGESLWEGGAFTNADVWVVAIESDSAGGSVELGPASITVASDLSGSMQSSKALSGSVAVSSSLAGDLSADRPLSGSVAASSSLGGSLVASRALSGSVAATTDLAGALIVARSLVGDVAAVAELTGSMAVARALVGQIDAVSSLAGTLDSQGQVALVGTIAAVSSLSGALSVERALSGSITAASSLSGSMAGVVPLTGLIAATSSASGSLSVARALAGSVGASSSMSGSLVAARGLSGSIVVTSDLSGAMSALKPLTGLITAVSSLSGVLADTQPVVISDVIGPLEVWSVFVPFEADTLAHIYVPILVLSLEASHA